jgi:phosphate transport system substrate-binding protein
MRRTTGWRSVAALLLCGLSLFACRRDSGPAITLAGSTSVQPFAERLAEVYMSQHHEVKVNVQGGGSSAGIRAVSSRICQVGMSSRSLTPEETGIDAIPIALDGIVLVVHKSNPVRSVTLDQVRAIFSGEVTNWREVGGPDHGITVITREEGSGTRASFEEQVMTPPRADKDGPKPEPQRFAADALVQDSNGSVREIVAGDPNAIGYISYGLVDDRVRALVLNGVTPDHETIKRGRYPVVRKFLFLTCDSVAPATRAFLDFTLSPEGQRVLEEEGLTTINK